MKLKYSETCQSLLTTEAEEQSGNKWRVGLNIKCLGPSSSG